MIRYVLVWRILLALSLLALQVTALPEPSNVLVGDLTFNRPQKWTWTDQGRITAVARFIVPDASEKEEASTDVRFYMTDRTVAQSVERWKSYFRPNDREGAREEKRTIGGREIVSMTLLGSYTFQGAKAKPGYRFVGTLIPSGNQFILIRMVGPDRLVRDATNDYTKMIEEALKDDGEK